MNNPKAIFCQGSQPYLHGQALRDLQMGKLTLSLGLCDKKIQILRLSLTSISTSDRSVGLAGALRGVLDHAHA